MMSVLSDISLARAGFDSALRDGISAAWRAEDYTTAANLIPDELLDAFMLCGTREDVAEKAMAFHRRAGLQLPLLQPVLQEERQVEELVAAAAIYAAMPADSCGRRGHAGEGRSREPRRRRTLTRPLPGASRATRSPTTGASARSNASGGVPARVGRSSGRSPTRHRSSRSRRAAPWRRSTGGSPCCRSWPPSPGASCSTPARTSSTRSTTSGRASTRSCRRGPATRS